MTKNEFETMMISVTKVWMKSEVLDFPNCSEKLLPKYSVIKESKEILFPCCASEGAPSFHSSQGGSFSDSAKWLEIEMQGQKKKAHTPVPRNICTST